MLEFFARIGRRLGHTVGRVFKPLSLLGKALRWFMFAVGLAGGGFAILKWSQLVKPWLVADWRNGALSAAVFLLLCSLLALYGREKEDDENEAHGMRISIQSLSAELLPSYEFSQANVFKNVLAVQARLLFQNNAANDRTAHPIEPLLQHRQGLRWRVMKFELGEGCSPYWFTRCRVASGDLKMETLSCHGCLPEEVFEHPAALRFVVEFVVPGQRNTKLLIPIDPKRPTAVESPQARLG